MTVYRSSTETNECKLFSSYFRLHVLLGIKHLLFCQVKFHEIPSEELVPGDIIEIKNMTTMQCDALLINGNVIVNESMLTGESVPVTKVEFQSSTATSNDQNLSVKDHNRHILFNGTQIVQLKFSDYQAIKAIVLRTGFNTTKGELVRAILYPKPVDFNFAYDTYKYIFALAIVGAVGLAIIIGLVSINQTMTAEVIKTPILDSYTTIVPPILPAALAAGLIFAQNNLARKKIFCISPSTINISGTLNCFVFDKTGTLTEDGMDLKFTLPSINGVFRQLIQSVDEFKNDCRLVQAMNTCHSLTFLNQKLVGDPLDLKLFEFTKSNLVEPSRELTDIFKHPITAVVHSSDKVCLIGF